MVSGGNQEAGSTAVGAKILIVDDDPDTLLGLTLILRKKGGHEVVAASDAIQAIMVAIREKPDLIVLDIGLPGGSGLQVLRNLKSNVATLCTPVIILTRCSTRSGRPCSDERRFPVDRGGRPGI